MMGPSGDMQAVGEEAGGGSAREEKVRLNKYVGSDWRRRVRRKTR